VFSLYLEPALRKSLLISATPVSGSSRAEGIDAQREGVV
jgi:hypothetical protein